MNLRSYCNNHELPILTVLTATTSVVSQSKLPKDSETVCSIKRQYFLKNQNGLVELSLDQYLEIFNDNDLTGRQLDILTLTSEDKSSPSCLRKINFFAKSSFVVSRQKAQELSQEIFQ